MFEATKEQIEGWKKEHGKVYRMQVGENHACYLKKPSRNVLGFAKMAAQDNPMKYNEVILTNCWLAGDEEIKQDDELFLSAGLKLGGLIDIYQAELGEL